MQLNNYSIEIIRKSEIKELAKYFVIYFEEIAKEEALTQKEYEKYLLLMYKNKNREFFWLFDNNNKCGFCIITFERNIPDINKLKARISEFYIFKNYRNKKIGTNFVNFIFDYFKNKDIREIIIEVHYENNIAFNFWKKFGFHIKKYIMKKAM